MASHKKKQKKQKTGDNMKTTDKQEKRTKVFFFIICYLQDVILVLESMCMCASLKIDSSKQWQVRDAN